jgi:hypothetical protein
MFEFLSKIIDELLRYREGSIRSTETFRHLKHNKQLCPAVEKKLNTVIECLNKFHNVAYDVQGIHDRGTDVLLRDSGEESEESNYIAFQIKSFDDLNSEDYLKQLKAQCFEALTEYGKELEQYYILLCTDKSAHENQIREIKKAFGASSAVTVIDPQYAMTFLRLNEIRITAIVDSVLRKDDFVYERAKTMLQDLIPSEVALTVAIVYESVINRKINLDMELIRNSKFIKDLYNRLPDYPRDYYFFFDEEDQYISEEGEDFAEEVERIYKFFGVKWVNGKFTLPTDRKRDFNIRLSEDLDLLDGQLFSIKGESGEIELDYEYALPIQAILLDAMVRYGYSGDDLLGYIFNALGVLKALGLEGLE